VLPTQAKRLQWLASRRFEALRRPIVRGRTDRPRCAQHPEPPELQSQILESGSRHPAYQKAFDWRPERPLV
jgi:hypothetical protein